MADQSPVPVKRPVGRPRKVPVDAAAPPKPKPKPKAKAKKKQTEPTSSWDALREYLPHLAPFGGLLISALSMAVGSVIKKGSRRRMSSSSQLNSHNSSLLCHCHS